MWLRERLQSTPQETKGAAVRIEPGKAVIGNEFLVWEMKLKKGRMSTAAVTNRRTGKVTTFQGEDFVLEFAGGRIIASSEFHVESVREQSLGGGGKQLIVQLTHRHAVAHLTTAINPGQWWAQRWLTIDAGPGRLEGVTFALGLRRQRGPSRPGNTVPALGFPSGCGQPLYVGDLFLAIAHPGADNFTTARGGCCRLAADDKIAADAPVRSREFVLGAGQAGAARRALLGYLDATRSAHAT